MRANLLRAFRRSTVYSFSAVALAAGLLPIGATPALSRETPQDDRARAARATVAQVDLGTATAFSVLAGQSVTNTGPTTVGGDLGVSPGTSVTGFPPGTVLGATHVADATAATAQTDLTTAYNDAAGRTPAASVSGDIGGQTLTPGVYNSTSTLGITGTLTLDGQGDPNAVFIIQVGSALTTASASVVNLTNGTQACNVFWQVGSSATLGNASTFQGTLLALTSITVNTGVQLLGRALARNGSVTLDTDTITTAICEPVPMMGLPGTAAGLALIGLIALRRRRRRRAAITRLHPARTDQGSRAGTRPISASDSTKK